MRTIIVSLFILLLTACAQRQPIYLRHPETNVVARCGGELSHIYKDAMLLQMREDKCTTDFMIQGYERMPPGWKP